MAVQRAYLRQHSPTPLFNQGIGVILNRAELGGIGPK